MQYNITGSAIDFNASLCSAGFLLGAPFCFGVLFLLTAALSLFGQQVARSGLARPPTSSFTPFVISLIPPLDPAA